ncbi:MAG: FKBP-type peptidyl-prolyl cis-trans isomerase SlyD [Candidatus Latescibacterota bacterium]|jgi:FKBP-type peptidyl-prolyl cis-trans isomerase SlyD
MQIAKNKVAIIEYTLKNDEGEVLDTSEGDAPMAYIQGIGNLIPGLEGALEGKVVDDEVQVSIPPEKGYGVPDPELVEVVARDTFQGVDDLQVGMQFQAEGDDGTQVIWITDVEGDEVTIDGNHPLAGETLNFAVKVVGVRDASAEELDHGHVHGPEGHQH